MKAALQTARTFLETLSIGSASLDLVYPRFCPGCDQALPKNSQVHLCPECREGLAVLKAPFCELCGEKFHGALAPSFRCKVCTERPPAFDFARAAYHSHELVRELVHGFKYERKMHFSPLLSELLADALKDRRFGRGNWILVPVPLHPRRKRQRHFNQAEELCMLLSKATGYPWIEGLRRVRYTIPQVQLEKTDRLRNLDGAFALCRSKKRREKLGKAQILLIDDVMTTGSTAHECAKILKHDAKASRVAVITVARAGTPPRG